MLRGDYVDLTVDQLNDLTDGSVTNELFKKHGKTNKSWNKWVTENDAEYRKALDEESAWYDSPLYGSLGLRTQIIHAGYTILDLYPCYHQGWEMDEWGAIGEKDGKKYIFETSHGGLCAPIEIKPGMIKKVAMNVLKVLGL